MVKNLPAIHKTWVWSLCPEDSLEMGVATHSRTEQLHFHALEKEMVTHSSVLAWRIPGIAEPGGLPFMGLHRVRHDWSNLAAAATCIYTLLGVSRLYSKHILSKFLGKIQINVWSYCNTNIFKLCMRTYFCVYICVRKKEQSLKSIPVSCPGILQ